MAFIYAKLVGVAQANQFIKSNWIYFCVFFFICYIVSKSWKDLQSPNIVIMQIGSGMMRVFQCEKFKGGDNR